MPRSRETKMIPCVKPVRTSLIFQWCPVIYFREIYWKIIHTFTDTADSQYDTGILCFPILWKKLNTLKCMYFTYQKVKKIIMEKKSGEAWNHWVITMDIGCTQKGNPVAVPFASNAPGFHSHQRTQWTSMLWQPSLGQRQYWISFGLATQIALRCASCNLRSEHTFL